MPIAYFSKPPDEICSSIDCHITRKFGGLDWRAVILADRFKGKAMPTVGNTLVGILSMACEQGLKEPLVRFSINQLADRSGVARQQVKEDIDYLHNIRIETNTYEIRENGLKEGKIRSYYLLSEIEKDYYEKSVNGRTVAYTRTYGVWLHPRLFEILKEKGALRYFPLDAKIMHSLTGREAKLYMIIFNEMLGRKRWKFHLGDLRQQLSMTTCDTGKIKREIRRLMKGLIDKGTGITGYDLDDRLLTVYGSLKGKVSLETEYSEVKEPELTAEVAEKLQTNKDKSDPIEKAKACLSKVGFTASQINQYAERYYKRIPYLCRYLENADFGFRVNKAGWLRKKLDLKTYGDCIGTWDEDFAYDNGISIDEVRDWIGRIENSVSEKMKTGTDKNDLRRMAILDLLYMHRENCSDFDLIERLASYMYGIDFTKEELKQKGAEMASQKKLSEMERKKQDHLALRAQKQQQQEELDKEIEELKNNQEMQREYASNYISAKEGARRANYDPEDKWTKEKTAIEEKFKRAGLDLGVMIQEEQRRREKMSRTTVYEDDA
jgi:hypothetical protein